MKKWFCIIITMILCVLIGCASRPAPSGYITLDQAIAEAAKNIEREIDAGSRIALLNFTSSSDLLSSYVLDELMANLLVNRRLIVVDRQEVDLIRSEFAFQFSGEVSDNSMQAVGNMLGAQYIVSGSLIQIGQSFRIVIRALNVQEATVAVQYRADIAAEQRVQALLAGGRMESVESARQATQEALSRLDAALGNQSVVGTSVESAGQATQEALSRLDAALGNQSVVGTSVESAGQATQEALSRLDATLGNQPVQLIGGTGFVSVSASGNRTVAIGTDGTLWAWGNNTPGLGAGTHYTAHHIPVQIGTAANWASVSAGRIHIAAIRTDGTLWTWGNNFYGQLGDGTATNRTVPIQIGTATNWACVDKSRKTAKISTKAQVSTKG